MLPGRRWMVSSASLSRVKIYELHVVLVLLAKQMLAALCHDAQRGNCEGALLQGKLEAVRTTGAEESVGHLRSASKLSPTHSIAKPFQRPSYVSRHRTFAMFGWCRCFRNSSSAR